MNVLIIGGCGYIGSQLGPFLRRQGMQIASVDLELYGNHGVDNQRTNYPKLTQVELAQYDQIILLAAHSSVNMALREPSAAFQNNIVGFVELLDKINQQKLLYASSSSVYSGVAGNPVDENWSAFNVGNIYDFSKYADDCLAGFSNKRTVGLRFGTVNGPSPNLRTDIMINKMVLTALRDGVVRIANPYVYRPILSIIDLCRAVAALLNHESSHGIYNLASFNATVNEIGQRIADLMQVKVECLAPSPTYDFSMSTKRIERELDFTFEETLPILVDRMVTHYQQFGLDEHGR